MSRKIYLTAGTATMAGAAAAMRLLALPPVLPDLDSVNFASSLARFDLAAQAPHFPGYPLYVLAARMFAALGAGEVAALALPGIVLGAAATAVVAWAVSTRVGVVSGFAAGALFAFAPMAILAGGGPTSDGAGIAALAIVLALHVAATSGAMGLPRSDAGGVANPVAPGVVRRFMTSNGRWAAAALGFAAAAAIGVRPSIAPAVMLLWLALPGRRRPMWFFGAAAGGIAWLAPMVAITGTGPFATIATGFLSGHGSTWGGTIASQPDLGGRLHAFAFDLFAANLAWPWPGAGSALRWIIAAGFAIPAIASARKWAGQGAGERRLLYVALLSCAPYALWAFVGQNLEKPRHLLPLVPGIALAWSAALPALRSWRPAPALLAGGVAACLLAIAVPASVAQGREPSPAAAMATALRSLLQPSGAMIFTGQEGKLVERFAPEFRAGRIADPERLEPEARRLADAGVTVYVTSAAPGASRLSAELEAVASFPAPQPELSGAPELVLYWLRPASLLAKGSK